MAANIRVKRIAAGLNNAPQIRVKSVAAGFQTPSAKIRVKRIVGAISTVEAKLRVKRIAAGISLPKTFAVEITTTAPTAMPALSLQSLTLTARALGLPSGDTVSTWVWAAANGDTPQVDSPSQISTKTRVPASITPKTLAWTVRGTSNSGISGTATVFVQAAAAQIITVDPQGVMHSQVFLGSSPVLYPRPVTLYSVNVRIRRIAAIIQQSVIAPPKPTTEVMVGARFTYPGNGDNRTDFNRGNLEYGGPTQITKDYESGTLPRFYTSPYPSSTRIILSMSSTVLYKTDPNFRTFIESVPTGTIMTYQHEPERPIFGWTGAEYAAILSEYRRVVRAIRTDLPVWLISGGYGYRPGGAASDGAYFTGLEVDGYALDDYRSAVVNKNAANPLVTPLPNNKQAAVGDRIEVINWLSFVPDGAPWGISEIGDGWATPEWNPAAPTVNGTIDQTIVKAQRLVNIQKSFDWMKNNGGLFFLYWISDGAAGGVPGPESYFPTDQGFKDLWAGLPRAVNNVLIP